MNLKLDEFDIKSNLIKSKYIFIYLILIILASVSMLSPDNYHHPKMEILAFCLVAVLGIIFIRYHLHNNDDGKLFMTAFIVILVFGLITSMVIPINSVSDEGEHFIRAEMTSRGVLFPEYENNSYTSISSIHTFYSKNTGHTVFETTDDTNSIDQSPYSVDSAFEQNPFYGYLFSGLGILIAKLLNLNVIWMLWLGRIFNSIAYAALISLAVKITPKLKMLIFSVSCLPVCLFQAFSVSIDSIITGLGILLIAYFIYLYENKFDAKHLAIFAAITFLIGMCKAPYLALIFLLLFLPKSNFKNKNYYAYVLLGIILVSIIGILWSKFSTAAYLHSWRMTYMLEHNVNMTSQIQFILSNPKSIVSYFAFILNYSQGIFESFFNFYNHGEYCGSQFISIILTLLYGFICLGYPTERRFDLKARFGIFLTFSIVYIGTFIVFLLTWTPVGELKIIGVHARYFLPLFAMLPLSFNINENKSYNIDKYMFVLTITFISAMIMSLIMKYY